MKKNIFFCIEMLFYASAYIFDSESEDIDVASLVNYPYNYDCLSDETIYGQIINFRKIYTQIQEISDDEFNYIEQRDFNEVLPRICEEKRRKASSVTDNIEHIANKCVMDEKIRKRIILNTLLIFQTKIDYVCSMNESIFEIVFKGHVEECISKKMDILDRCREKSLKTLFFEKNPKKLFLIQLLNSAICSFDYDKMITCAHEELSGCKGKGANEALAYLLDIIKRNSLCSHMKDVSDVIDSIEDNTTLGSENRIENK